MSQVQDKLTKIATEAYGGGAASSPGAPSRPANMFLPHQLNKPAGQCRHKDNRICARSVTGIVHREYLRLLLPAFCIVQTDGDGL